MIFQIRAEINQNSRNLLFLLSKLSSLRYLVISAIWRVNKSQDGTSSTLAQLCLQGFGCGFLKTNVTSISFD